LTKPTAQEFIHTGCAPLKGGANLSERMGVDKSE
jgi:hypothetical protein